MSNKFYTPDGFNDTLPSVCAFKKDAESKLRRLFSYLIPIGIIFLNTYMPMIQSIPVRGRLPELQESSMNMSSLC